MLSEKELIKQCKAKDKKAEEQLYERYAPKMWGVCMRFAKNRMGAEDIMQEGFVKVFAKLDQYNDQGSFEGWIRKTIINTAINHYKKNINYNKELDLDEVTIKNQIEPRVIDQLTVNELMEVIRELPEGYRLVFNLFVLEGYSHKEIADNLDITENTSKSQLSRARNVLQQQIKKKLNIKGING
ncbi:MAG: sigma-70 family RNA polymerase sigma factor [Bacteroidales bacterium]|nr:sigma-70 family RNA polymerase sigma factor [Bacteroidales bacterium]